MNDIIFKIMEVFVYVCVALVTRYAVPAIREYISQSRYAFLADLVVDAVFAVEQQIQGEHKGETRKEIVSEYAKKMAEQYGVDVTPEQINIMIEAAVKAMNLNQQNPTAE